MSFNKNLSLRVFVYTSPCVRRGGSLHDFGYIQNANIAEHPPTPVV